MDYLVLPLIYILICPGLLLVPLLLGYGIYYAVTGKRPPPAPPGAFSQTSSAANVLSQGYDW
jgi:hypothetical protein